jgi:hypothetical protein
LRDRYDIFAGKERLLNDNTIRPGGEDGQIQGHQERHEKEAQQNR